MWYEIELKIGKSLKSFQNIHLKFSYENEL